MIEISQQKMPKGAYKLICLICLIFEDSLVSYILIFLTMIQFVRILNMGQPLQACCNPATIPNQQSQIHSFDKNKLEFVATGFRPSSNSKTIDKDLQQTLKQALIYRRNKTELSSEDLWMMEVKNDEGKVNQIYCKGSMVDNEINGEAQLYFPSGQIFRGKVLSRQPVQGVFVFRKGIFYCGQISQFNAEGEGRYENSESGYTYDGTWSKSLPYGKGRQMYKNGDLYEGDITYGEKFGQGIYRFTDGRVYQGSFYMNQSDGRGKMTYPNDDYYDGEWKLGKFHGQGKFMWKKGEFYEGSYENGIRQGLGKYTFQNGSWYEGQWFNGRQSGQGIFHQGYDQISGNWVNGQLAL